MSEEFARLAREIKTEQLLKEKHASRRAPAVAVTTLARAAEAEDQDLLKLACLYCPDAPLEFYEKELGGKFKEAGARRAARLLARDYVKGRQPSAETVRALEKLQRRADKYPGGMQGLAETSGAKHIKAKAQNLKSEYERVGGHPILKVKVPSGKPANA